MAYSLVVGIFWFLVGYVFGSFVVRTLNRCCKINEQQSISR